MYKWGVTDNVVVSMHKLSSKYENAQELGVYNLEEFLMMRKNKYQRRLAYQSTRARFLTEPFASPLAWLLD